MSSNGPKRLRTENASRSVPCIRNSTKATEAAQTSTPVENSAEFLLALPTTRLSEKQLTNGTLATTATVPLVQHQTRSMDSSYLMYRQLKSNVPSQCKSDSQSINRLDLAPPEQKPAPCIFRRTKTLRNAASSWSVCLQEGDVLALQGIYDIWIHKGAVSIYGAVLRASPHLQRIVAPTTHSIPSLRVSRDPYGAHSQEAVMTILSCGTGANFLECFSPQSDRNWKASKGGPASPDLWTDVSRRRTFHTLDGVMQQSSLRILNIPLDWTRFLGRAGGEDGKRQRSYLVCGPKGAGKSTFTKVLVNSILSQQRDSPGSSGVALLDIDPGQPEFQPPGSISLMLIKSFITSAQFTHPLSPNASGVDIIRCHFVGSLTPRDDPSYFLECCLNLFNEYHNIRLVDTTANPSLPLVINCYGWVVGIGLDILIDLISRILPSHVIYMGTQEPEELDSRLPAVVSTLPSSFHVLTSQSSPLTTHDASDLRLIQTLSYYHQDYSPNGFLKWKFPPLQLSELSILPYAGEGQLIHGIIDLGDETSTDCVARLIENSMFGVVLVKDEKVSANPGLDSDGKISYIAHSQSGASSSKETRFVDANRSAKYQARHFDEDESGHSQVVYTPEHIPFLPLEADRQRLLKPSRVHTVGQIVIYKVNTHNRSFEAATPFPQNSFEYWEKLGFKVVLVRGQLDSPAWTHSDPPAKSLVKKSIFFRRIIRERGLSDSISSKGILELGSMYEIDPSKFDKAWIKIAYTNHSARYKSKVWRSRKNLRLYTSGDS